MSKNIIKKNRDTITFLVTCDGSGVTTTVEVPNNQEKLWENVEKNLEKEGWVGCFPKIVPAGSKNKYLDFCSAKVRDDFFNKDIVEELNLSDEKYANKISSKEISYFTYSSEILDGSPLETFDYFVNNKTKLNVVSIEELFLMKILFKKLVDKYTNEARTIFENTFPYCLLILNNLNRETTLSDYEKIPNIIIKIYQNFKSELYMFPFEKLMNIYINYDFDSKEMYELINMKND